MVALNDFPTEVVNPAFIRLRVNFGQELPNALDK
jgi:hypothetical protein